MKKILAYIDQNGEVILMYLAALVLVCSVTLQMLSRAIMMPIPWTEELARYAFIWLTYFGIGFGIRNESHTRFEIFDNLMSPAVKAFLKIFYAVLGLIAWGIVFYASFDFLKLTSANRAPAMNITILTRNLAVVVGAIIVLIRLIQRLVLDISAFIQIVKERKEEKA